MNKTDLAYALIAPVFDGTSSTATFLEQTEQKLIALLDGATPLEQGAIYGCIESIGMLRGGAPDAR